MLRSSRRLVPVAMLLLLVPLASCDPSAGGEPPPAKSNVGGADTTLHFTVVPSGKISAPVSMGVPKGTNVKLLLENRTGTQYRLRVVDADGHKEAVAVARPEHLGQTNLVFTTLGRHQVIVLRGAQSSPAGTYPVQVSE